ncbi:hypothetical protein V6N13_014847 [Hibiscus sabdariffa]
MVAYEMIHNLKEIYEGQARQERYETSKALFQCNMSEGSPVGAHVIKMMGYIQTLEKLGFPLNDELAIDVIMQLLRDSFNQFVLNFNMNEINKTLPQLLGMLRTAENNKKKNRSKSVLMVRVAKRKGKKVAKSKGIGKTKPKGKNANSLTPDPKSVPQDNPPINVKQHTMENISEPIAEKINKTANSLTPDPNYNTPREKKEEFFLLLMSKKIYR